MKDAGKMKTSESSSDDYGKSGHFKESYDRVNVKQWNREDKKYG